MEQTDLESDPDSVFLPGRPWPVSLDFTANSVKCESFSNVRLEGQVQWSPESWAWTECPPTAGPFPLGRGGWEWKLILSSFLNPSIVFFD